MPRLDFDRIPGAGAFLLYLVLAVLLQGASYWLGGGAPQQIGAFFAGIFIVFLSLIALPARAFAAGRAQTVLLLWPLLGGLPAIIAVALYDDASDNTMIPLIQWINFFAFIPALVLGPIVVGLMNRKKARR